MKRDVIWLLVLVVVIFLFATTWYQKNEQIKLLKDENKICSEALTSAKQEIEDEKAIANQTKERLVEAELKLTKIKQ